MDFFNSINVYGLSAALRTEEGEVMPYGDLASCADKIGEAVDGRCIVFCVCSNNVESLAGYLGMLRRKAVPVLVNLSTNLSLLADLLRAYSPRYIYLPSRAVGGFPGWKCVLTFRQYSLLRAPAAMTYPVHPDLALLLTTSGSTGSPKLVRQSYGNIVNNAESIAKYLGIAASDKPITTLPMSYTYGLSIINSHLLMGATVLLTDKPVLNRGFWQFLRKRGATTFGGVPYIYELLKRLKFAHMDLPTLRILTQAGGRLDPELTREFAEICLAKGIRFVVMYGQTEATARISYLPPEYALSKAGSIGVAIPGGELSLIDDKGGIIEDSDVSGELVYKGPNVTLGYADTYADLAKGDENKGVLKTGDLAKRDIDGFYYIVGRKKRFLKLFGNRVNLDEVENILKSAGFNCACTGRDDLMVIYTCADDVAAVREHILRHTTVNPNGFIVKKTQAIPRNETGKILYSAID
jgi:acyl-CoA synthetase (AMP-forming)/AMP-acid ligase II